MIVRIPIPSTSPSLGEIAKWCDENIGKWPKWKSARVFTKSFGVTDNYCDIDIPDDNLAVMIKLRFG